MDERIAKAIYAANEEKCKRCKAMEHANEVEKEQERK